jgi:hypothetical protein
MRRYLLVLMCAAVLAALLAPASASASSWVVKDGSGKKLGKVVRTGSRKCEVFLRSGKYHGYVRWESWSGGWVAREWPRGSTGPGKGAILSKRGPYFWQIENLDLSHVGGRAVRSSVWKVYKGDGGRVRARVPGSCPGWMAAGAAFILSPAFPR